MKIKRLDVSGFKSFCDQTRILFDSSLTAVVGPNGCGKSNIVDAIRWALGEQSAMNLRGKGMEDVIFNGTETRGPKSMAEVTLTFDNDDGLSHPTYVEYPEITVTRRLHRDSTSDYLINKAPCRLKDITDLFLGTGGGTKAYSIIEQGRIELIVSSRSEDRRAMIEEAAGITRFKKARQTASRKMDKTRQNLLRITDVVAEMERNLSVLKRQAKKAERFTRYATEQRDLESYIASHKYLELCAVKKSVVANLAQAEAHADESRSDLENKEAGVASLRLEEATARNTLEEGKTRAYAVDGEIHIIESEIKHLIETMERLKLEEQGSVEQEATAELKKASLDEERGVLFARIDAIKQDAVTTSAQREEAERLASEAREQLSVLGKNFDARRDDMSRARARVAASMSALENLGPRVDEAEARLTTTCSQRGDLEKRIAELSIMLSDLRGRSELMEGSLESTVAVVESESTAFEQLRLSLDECDEERQTVRDDLQSRVSRLASLEEVNTGLERHDRSVREAVEALREEDGMAFSGLLIDFIECPAQYEVALAAVLSDRLQALVTDNHETGMMMLDWLAQRDLGRVTALPLAGTVDSESASVFRDGSGVVGKLTDFIHVDPIVGEIADCLLGGVYIVESIDDARRIWESDGGHATVVTRDGQLLDANGVMRGGRANSPGADLLGQKREIRDLEKEASTLRALYDDLDSRFGTTKEELLRRRDAAENARQEAQQQEVVLAEVRKDTLRAKEDLEADRQRLDGLDREITHQKTLVREAVEDRDLAQKEMTSASEEIEVLDKIISEYTTTIEGCRGEADRLAAAAIDARVKEARFDQQHQAALDRENQILASVLEINEQMEQLAAKKASAAREMGRAAGKVVQLKESLYVTLGEVDCLDGQMKDLNRALDYSSRALLEAEASLKDQRKVVEETRANVSELHMSEQQAQMDVSHLLESVAERFNENLLQIVGDYHMRPVPGQDVRLRIEDLKRLIERMGAINPAAIEDYKNTAERYEDKVEHKADVEQALEDLEAAIARMDKDSRRLFRETFASVNEKFQQIFPRLFEGGQARLVLTNPDDMLETGVDIIAQPQGKNLLSIELMSGGEKALTAVSLLFALFLHRPSPFCLLDEVDAPLDEANVGRFVELVRELTDRSQFIVITHSKVTMEGADALYGVTMQEPGISKMVSVRLVHSDAIAVNE